MKRWTLSLGLMLAAAPAMAQRAPASSWVRSATLYEVFVRDFSPGGNLAGVTAGLGRIQSTGANCIWIMPIQPVSMLNRKGSLGSPYSLHDYRAIDSAFGTTADFKALVRAAHARGMKVILDWVPDHTGWDNPWIREHPEYYARNAAGEITVPRDAQGKLTDWTDVAQLDYGNAGLRAAMLDVMQWWLREYGLDGFRVDVAGFIPNAFWSEAVPALRASVPRPILLLAEWGDIELNRIGFDLTYGWGGYSRLKEVWGGAPAAGFLQRVLAEQDSMPPGGMRLRFTTNHDETAWDNPAVTRFLGPAGARAAFVAMALLPGRPLLYNGQEVESPQRLPLFEREAVVWEQPGAAAARDFYRRVLDLARTHPAFFRGNIAAMETSAPDDVIAYRRNTAMVLVNARPHEVRVTVPGARLRGTRDLLSRRPVRGDTLTLPAYGAVVLERR